MKKLFILLSLSLWILGCAPAEKEKAAGEKIFENFKSPAGKYWPGVRFAVQGNFDGKNKTHLQGLESELRELNSVGVSTIEIQTSSMGNASKLEQYRNELKVFYNVGNELGMSMC